MIFFDRYCAVEVAEFVEEVELTPQGALFALWKQRKHNALITRLPTDHWQIVDRLKNLASDPTQPTVVQEYCKAGLSLEFNPVILTRCQPRQECPQGSIQCALHYFRVDAYEKCLAHFLLARQMIRMGDIEQAKDYTIAFDRNISTYADALRNCEHTENKPGLMFLIQYVYLEVDSLAASISQPQQWEMDRQYYLNQIAKYGW